MSNQISEYYINEINSWKESIDFYYKQIDQFEVWLREIIQLNTIPQLSSSVNHFLRRFEDKRNSFESFRLKCLEWHDQLIDKEEESPVEDKMVTGDLRLMHRDLRDKMRVLEREYLELKYAADEFVADTLAAQIHE